MESRAESTWKTKRIGAKRDKIPFDLTIEWYQERLTRNVCEVTGVQFEYSGGYRRNPFSPETDRIDPAKGYLIDNCRLVCSIYNMAKLNWTDAHVLKMATALVYKDTLELDSDYSYSTNGYVSKALRSTYVSVTAKMFNVTRPTVYAWIASDNIPAKYIKQVRLYADKFNLNKKLLCPSAYGH